MGCGFLTFSCGYIKNINAHWPNDKTPVLTDRWNTEPIVERAREIWSRVSGMRHTQSFCSGSWWWCSGICVRVPGMDDEIAQCNVFYWIETQMMMNADTIDGKEIYISSNCLIIFSFLCSFHWLAMEFGSLTNVQQKQKYYDDFWVLGIHILLFE